MKSSKWSWLAPVWFALATLLILGPTIFRPDRLLSGQDTDVAMYFLQARIFGFGELANGNLALWNPFLYGGTPFLAGFQSALLYPPNWLHLLMPVAPAINWITALHLFAAGYFTYLWLHHSSIGRIGSIVGGTMFMFCGPYYLHLYAGHLPHLNVMVWVPLIFLSIGKLADTGHWRWCVLGAIAVAMQILAGHPQYCFYTAIGCGVLALLQLTRSQHRIAILGGMLVVYLGGAMLSAAQLFPGIEALGENVRSGGTAYKFASTIALAPSQLLTALVPRFFGEWPLPPGSADQYWGPVYLWEESAFIGVCGLPLAIVGAVRVRDKMNRIAIAMVVITLLLALGRHTPLYQFLFDYFPLYGSFRGTSKFAFLAALWMAYLGAVGVESLIERPRISRNALVAIVLCGVILAMLGEAIRISASAAESGRWGQFVHSTWQSTKEAGEQFLLDESQVRDTALIARSAATAANGSFVSAGLLLGIAVVLFAGYWKPKLVFVLPVIAVAELLFFAWGNCGSMDPSLVAHLPPKWKPAIERLNEHERVLIADPFWMSHPMSDRVEAAWGYDPQLLRRYAETMFVSQGFEPSAAMQYLNWHQPHRNIFSMMRIRFILLSDEKVKIAEMPQPMPMLQLVNQFAVAPNSREILAALSDPNFNPRTTVLLESTPDIKPAASSIPGTTTLAHWSTDSLEIKADAPSDCILLITNNYSAGWRASSVGPSLQDGYTILPANHTLQAIPLRAGRHHIRLEYCPTGFIVGFWVSIVSWLTLFSIIVYRIHKRRRPVTKRA